MYHDVGSCHCSYILYIYIVLILNGILWTGVLCYLYVIYFASVMDEGKKVHLALNGMLFPARLQIRLESFEAHHTLVRPLKDVCK